ncbi:hypothetical protein C2S53_019003 [Perilla frutescens var. hirtella]|uniref:Uncharacterized protein n=1 Tax=Perilla frutescens var. hirtella TaxID=608512 RepID=A0AAD4JJC1_PERFH|nr:hypothetical protein C2S53_019003 [Perilla frutescens var. hirtella]
MKFACHLVNQELTFKEDLAPLFMMMMIIIFILFPSLPTLYSSTTHASQNFPLAKPNCVDRCGNISIPYPAGTSPECYHNPIFWVTCNHSFNPPKLFWQDSTQEITDISLDGQVKIMQFIGRDCYTRNGTRALYTNPWIQLATYITVNHTANKFTMVGCDAEASVSGRRHNGRKFRTGCTATCEAKDDLKEGSCMGLGCCQTSIPEDVFELMFELKSYSNYSDVWEFNNCSYAFVVDESSFRFSPENLTNLRDADELPMVIDWAIGNETCAEAEATTYACVSPHSSCYEPESGYGYRCRCHRGYQGNPYLFNGCQDVNECEMSSLNNCEHGCRNTIGNYTCTCPRGYHGDGREDGEGCSRDELLILRLVAGIAVGIIILLLCAILLHLELRRRSLVKTKQRLFLQNGGMLLQEKLMTRERAADMVKIFTSAELQKATNDFDHKMIIGQGGFGTVYKGVLSDKSIVAIKKSKKVDPNQIEQFINEVFVLSQVNHRNVVRLLGCCLETEVPLLVYEFISNGTLAQHVHNQVKARLLNWETRLKIAAETAGVLSYLHYAASTSIIHRDVKSDNILLDHIFTAKVSDFGASRLVPMDLTELSTMVQGTFGYLDPEYMQTNQLTEKSDVYSFGVVLSELLTGRKALSFDRPEEEQNLANFFLYIVKEERLSEILDVNIAAERNMEQITEVARVAKGCLQVRGEDRPTMKEVATELEGLILAGKQALLARNEESIEEMEKECLLKNEVVVNENPLPNVEDMCGNVRIPYPFGMSNECCLNKNFLVTCNSSKPFLGRSTINITDINLDGELRVLTRIGRSCYDSSGINVRTNLRLAKFSINDTLNKFVVIGCDSYAYLRGRGRQDVNIDGACDGVGCCQTSVRKGMLQANLSVRSFNNHSRVRGFNPCSYGFMVEDAKFRFSPENLTNLQHVEKLPIVLAWTVGNQTCEEAKRNTTSYACKDNSFCYDMPEGYSGYRCSCLQGYQGNPYLVNGCTDIDECRDDSKNNCTMKDLCKNTEGNYTCSCPKGYSGLGWGDDGCSKKESVKLTNVVIGVAFGVMALLLVAMMVYFELKRRSSEKTKQRFFHQNGGILLEEKLKGREGSADMVKIYSSIELQKATDEFHSDNIIGQGGFGTVYKGFLPGNRVVAIKKSKRVDPNEIEQFINEVIVLSQINHRNVVRLLGCCLETEVPHLVYEFINNGTLSSHLHDPAKARFLNWEMRLKIAAEAAGVLSYLHSAASTPIIHRDMKSDNILLDHTFTAKVADFGASKLVPLDQTQLMTLVQGTFGYLDPEYMQTHQLTEKSDVYSFGVVLVELLTGRMAISNNRPEKERNLVIFFLFTLKQGRLSEILDENIVGDDNDENMEEVSEVANLAKVCLSVKGEDRPSMKEVAMELEGLIIGGKHKWARNVDNIEETESLLQKGEALNHHFSNGDGNSSSVGYDTIRGHVVLPISGGR